MAKGWHPPLGIPGSATDVIVSVMEWNLLPLIRS